MSDGLILEVVVETADEARDAECGGADRIELLADLGRGGFSPPAARVDEVRRATTLPLRVMVREADGFESPASAVEWGRLTARVRDYAAAGAEGIVLGFVTGDGGLDVDLMAELLAAAPALRASCHRALEATANPAAELARMERLLPAIDRVLASGGDGAWPVRVERLERLQQAAARIAVVPAAGLDEAGMATVRRSSLREVHIGVMARTPRTAAGRLTVEQVAIARRLSGPRAVHARV